ncbi:MAG: type II secretion system protein [Planctomycetota bacterium]
MTSWSSSNGALFSMRADPDRRSAGGDRRRSGFTMVELLIVIALIVFLVALVVVNAGDLRNRAKRESVKSLIQRLGMQLETYHSKVGPYPSDGFDTPVETPQGTRLKSGAALTFALLQPIQLTQRLPNGDLRVLGTEEPVAEFADNDLSEAIDDDRDARELLDAWGNPLHYDNLEGGASAYSVQDDGSAHLHEPLAHAFDPREQEGEGVELTGPQNPGEYDLWSHGSSGHTDDEKATDTIGNWEHKGEKARSKEEEE